MCGLWFDGFLCLRIGLMDFVFGLLLFVNCGLMDFMFGLLLFVILGKKISRVSLDL